jgi:hypothetical protein
LPIHKGHSMTVVPCPNCGRGLNLSDELRGRLVRCSACAAAFQAPEEASNREVAPRPVKAPEQPIYSPVEVGDEPDSVDDALSPQERLRSAARWMRGLVIVQALFTIPCCCSWLIGTLNDPRILLFTPGLLLFFCALALVYSGAYQLEARRSYRAALAGAVVALLVSLSSLLLAGAASIAAQSLIGNGPSDDLCIALVISLSTLVLAVFGLVGTAKALFALFDPRVRAIFR